MKGGWPDFETDILIVNLKNHVKSVCQKSSPLTVNLISLGRGTLVLRMEFSGRVFPSRYDVQSPGFDLNGIENSSLVTNLNLQLKFSTVVNIQNACDIMA